MELAHWSARPAPQSSPDHPRIPDVVGRPRLTSLIVERVEAHSVVRVVAAAGAGKTTAVAQASAEFGRPVAWINLQDWHAVAGRLCDDLVRAFSYIAPGLSSEVDRARSRHADPLEIAGIIGSLASLGRAVLVVDDADGLREWPEANAVLSQLIKVGTPSLRAVVVGRAEARLMGLGLEALDPAGVITDAELRATPEEATAILRARREEPSDDALRAADGWVAGLVFEAWGASREGLSDRLEEYLRREVRPRLSPASDDLLLRTSLFDEVDHARARALGAADPRLAFLEFREAGLPASWASDHRSMRLHPRIREVLKAELRGGPTERLLDAARVTASVLEVEGDTERAADLYREASAQAELARIVPDLALRLIERRDLARARHHLDLVAFDPPPARVVLAQLVMNMMNGTPGAAVELLNRTPPERLLGLVREEPGVGAFACHFIAAQGRLADAATLLESIPPGRAADVARLALTLLRDDPEAPIPLFAGDVLDASLARLLWSRGRFAELREGRTAWLDESGVLKLGAAGTGTSPTGLTSSLTQPLVAFIEAIEVRDAAAARRSVAALHHGGHLTWALLCKAELAVRLERDPKGALAAVGRLRGEGAGAAMFFGELLDTWEGGALLVDGRDEDAAVLLASVTRRMTAGDRRLLLATALTYHAEALWRIGDEAGSDAATNEAYTVAHSQGGLRQLMLALTDFPGVLSRRLDADPPDRGVWRALGRALARGRRSRPSVEPAAYLREFGRPGIVAGSELRRPRISKSLDLLSFLVATGGHSTRPVVLDGLWGRDDESARTYLRQTLRHLRATLPPSVEIVAQDEDLRIEGAVTSESLEFEILSAEAGNEVGPRRLALFLEALEIVRRGPFLSGSKAEGWVEERRAAIAEKANWIQLEAAEILLDSGRLVEALALITEALDRNPLLERGWRLRMHAHGLLGDDDGVLDAYRACVHALADIGLLPSPATKDVARTFRR